MAKHMPDVAAHQPQACQQCAGEQNQEYLGEERCGHGSPGQGMWLRVIMD